MPLSLHWPKRQELSVGIDLGADTTKVVCLQSTGTEYTLMAHALLRKEKRGSLIEFLHHSSLSKAAIRVAIQAPIQVQPLSVPIVPADELDAVVSWAFKDASNINVDDYLIRFAKKNIDAATNQQNLTAFAIEKTFFDQWLNFVRDIGPNVTFAEPDIQALANLIIYSYNLKDNDRYAVIDIGRSQSQLAIVSCYGIEFYRSFSGLGGASLISSLHTESDETTEQSDLLSSKIFSQPLSEQDEEIVDAINGFCAKLCVQAQYAIESYTAQVKDRPITNIILTGGVARLANLKDQIQETLHFPTDIIEPFTKLNLDRFTGTNFNSYKSLYAIAAGLAL